MYIFQVFLTISLQPASDDRVAKILIENKFVRKIETEMDLCNFL